MRLVAFATAAAALIVTTVPAAAAWTQVKYPELGVAKDWPSTPQHTVVQYKTPVAGTAMADLYTSEVDNIVYTMEVVNLQNKIPQGASIMGECVYLAEDAGKPVAEMTTRVEYGANAVYGRLISVDVKDNKGRAMTACFYTKGRLYKIQALIKPAHGDPQDSDAIRFVNSLSFNLKDVNEPE